MVEKPNYNSVMLYHYPLSKQLHKQTIGLICHINKKKKKKKKQSNLFLIISEILNIIEDRPTYRFNHTKSYVLKQTLNLS
jgi:hypothetical protein